MQQGAFLALPIRMVLIYLILTGILPDLAMSQDKLNECKEFSMADPGGSMEHVPIRDQGNTGTCYAYAAASAVDAWRFSATPPGNRSFQTSPHAVAISYKSNMNKKNRGRNLIEVMDLFTLPIDYGWPVRTLRSIKKNGICDYNAFGANFEDSIFKTNIEPFWSTLHNLYKTYHEKYKSTLLEDNSSEKARVLNDAAEKLTAHLCLGNFNSNQRNFNNLEQIRNFLLSEDIFNGFQVISERICDGHKMALPDNFPEQPISFTVQDIVPHEAQKSKKAKSLIFKRVINQMLNFKKRQPIVVSYNQEILSDPNSPSTKATHASLIIGKKRLVDGRCGYLIRNSWGVDPDIYGNTGRIEKTGDILVAEDDLLRSIDEVSVLPPQNERYQPPSNTYDGVSELLKKDAKKTKGGMGMGMEREAE